jgi:hypothetical protein
MQLSCIRSSRYSGHLAVKSDRGQNSLFLSGPELPRLSVFRSVERRRKAVLMYFQRPQAAGTRNCARSKLYIVAAMSCEHFMAQCDSNFGQSG